MLEKIVVIGMGYIGLPTALLFANAGFQVVGVEKDKEKIKKIEKGVLYVEESNLVDLYKKVKMNFKITDKLEEGEVYIICVQTPLTKSKKVNLNYLFKAAKEVGNILKKGNLVIIESTVPPQGTKIISRLLSKFSSLKENEFYVAHCPERAFPTKLIKELAENNKIIGGINKESSEKAEKLYSKIIKGKIIKTTSDISEIVKLVENIYRDINIAFANELSIICDKLNLNVFDIIKLANTHPRVNIHKPSAGVGGSCIPVDAYFISNYINKKDCRLMLTARKINDYKPKYIARKVKWKNTGVLGVTYKPDVNDIRLSPAEIIIKELLRKKHKVLVFDPYSSETFGGKGVSIKKLLNSKTIIIATPHNVFNKYKKILINKNVIDPSNFLGDNI